MTKGWKLCKSKNGCSKNSPDNEFVHDGQWKVKKKAA